MEKKDDRENLGDDLGQRQCLFLLELSSALQDRVPSPEIVFAQMIRSNEAIRDMIFSFLLLTVSAPPEMSRVKKSAGCPRLAMYTTRLHRLQKPHLSQHQQNLRSNYFAYFA